MANIAKDTTRRNSSNLEPALTAPQAERLTPVFEEEVQPNDETDDPDQVYRELYGDVWAEYGPEDEDQDGNEPSAESQGHDELDGEDENKEELDDEDVTKSESEDEGEPELVQDSDLKSIEEDDRPFCNHARCSFCYEHWRRQHFGERSLPSPPGTPEQDAGIPAAPVRGANPQPPAAEPLPVSPQGAFFSPMQLDPDVTFDANIEPSPATVSPRTQRPTPSVLIDTSILRELPRLTFRHFDHAYSESVRVIWIQMIVATTTWFTQHAGEQMDATRMRREFRVLLGGYDPFDGIGVEGDILRRALFAIDRRFFVAALIERAMRMWDLHFGPLE
ncbi:unnamed protein product [Zymoseptoria tritici ST99CH_1A5]|uniref:Uncharacterized protein n=2 Tax=Zymoseptoria tritici TaxID=1047171 RepID=F9XFQ7_ZYMTI|nr:uncharacterized protein MYCGRDRAFT_94450 [Zymoseptoria tritici IPO323]EGP86144.1 hypothetical protein MYCGRDRAFT_94450 [Zymoseptoria tritici IPO323]SMY26097.1 unnamed protein product [Zymoseptoria tritici ST99CH_1A5]